MEVLAQLLSSSLSGCGRKLVGFALKVQVSGDLWSPAVDLFMSDSWNHLHLWDAIGLGVVPTLPHWL